MTDTGPQRRPSRISAEAEAAATNRHSETRKRSEQVLVRFTPDELVAAKALAAAHDMTVPELLRVCLLAMQVQEARNG